MRQTVAHGAAVDAELNTLSLADFRGPAPARSQFVRLCYKNCPFVSSGHFGEDAMPSIKFWSRSLSRVELDQSSREARLRLERMERLISRAAVRLPWLRRLLSLLSVRTAY